MSLPGPNYIGKTKSAPDQVKHMAVRSDKTFAGQLTRTVGRDRNTRPVIFSKSDIGILAIDAAAGSVDDPARTGHAHRFQNILGEVSSFPEINVRLSHCFRDVGIRREMDDRVAPGHGRLHLARFLQVAANDFYSRVPGAFLDKRQPAGAEVVEHNHALSDGLP